jgi:hypothetical protein
MNVKELNGFDIINVNKKAMFSKNHIMAFIISVTRSVHAVPVAVKVDTLGVQVGNVLTAIRLVNP